MQEKRFEPYPYCLSWDSKNNEIIIITFSDLIKKARELKSHLTEKNLIVLHFKTIFNFSFNCNLWNGETFGFNDSATCLEEGEVFKFKIKLPEILRKTANKCNTCGGTGKESRIDVICLDCRGDGKKSEQGNGNAYASLATIKFIFSLLDFLFRETDKKGIGKRQFLEVNISISKELLDGFSIWGSVSRDFWEKITADLDSEEIVNSMKQAYRVMWNYDDSFSEYQFEANLSYNGFMISCPGNASCIITQKTDSDDYDGRKHFSYHNVDRPDQVFLMLIGLASLCDLIKEKEYKMV